MFAKFWTRLYWNGHDCHHVNACFVCYVLRSFFIGLCKCLASKAKQKKTRIIIHDISIDFHRAKLITPTYFISKWRCWLTLLIVLPLWRKAKQLFERDIIVPFVEHKTDIDWFSEQFHTWANFVSIFKSITIIRVWLFWIESARNRSFRICEAICIGNFSIYSNHFFIFLNSQF